MLENIWFQKVALWCRNISCHYSKKIFGSGMSEIKTFNTRVVVFKILRILKTLKRSFIPGWRCNEDFRKLNFPKTSTSGNLAGSFLPMLHRSLTRSSGAKKLPCGALLPKISYGWSRRVGTYRHLLYLRISHRVLN